MLLRDITKIMRLTGKKADASRNNPFDIVYTDGSKKFEGVIGEKNGFCKFDTLEHGCRAGMKLIIESYINKGFDSPESFVKRYSSTDQQVYILYIENNMGCTSPTEKFKHDVDTVCKLGHYVTVFEGQLGKTGVEESYLKDIVNKYKIKVS